MSGPPREPPPRQVVDSQGTPFRLALPPLGEGGQGVVYRTHDGRVAVKLITSGREQEALLSRLRRLTTRPLWDLPLSRPLSVLERLAGQVGYTMDLLTDVQPLWKLITPGRDFEDDKDFLNWYCRETGGLRHRLVLLGRAADTLAWLHGLALVYADPSANNVLVARAPDSDDVWLIDPDNIGLRAAPDLPEARTYGTPPTVTAFTEDFAAPELVTGRSDADTRSDAFAFAVMAFRTLTTLHPFLGDAILEGDPSLEMAAYRGNRPWVLHPTKTSNQASPVFPLDYVLTDRLMRLSRRAFEDGHRDPGKRPAVSEWADALLDASGRTHRCEQCGGSFYPFVGTQRRTACPWCEAPAADFVMMTLRVWTPPFAEPVTGQSWPGGTAPKTRPVLQAIIPAKGSLNVTGRMAQAGPGALRHETLLRIEYRSDGLLFSPNADVEAFMALGKEPLTAPTLQEWGGRPNERRFSYLHFGPSDQTHRAATFFEFKAQPQ